MRGARAWLAVLVATLLAGTAALALWVTGGDADRPGARVPAITLDPATGASQVREDAPSDTMSPADPEASTGADSGGAPAVRPLPPERAGVAADDDGPGDDGPEDDGPGDDGPEDDGPGDDTSEADGDDDDGGGDD